MLAFLFAYGRDCEQVVPALYAADVAHQKQPLLLAEDVAALWAAPPDLVRVAIRECDPVSDQLNYHGRAIEGHSLVSGSLV
jgi:hypothetical protein